MSLPYKHNLVGISKSLRKRATRQEKRLWYQFLSKYPVRFQRQKAINAYIVDFYCHAAKLVIELDGAQHYTDDGLEQDAQRDKTLALYGLKVLRFLNKDVDQNFEGVCIYIHQEVQKRIRELSEQG